MATKAKKKGNQRQPGANTSTKSAWQGSIDYEALDDLVRGLNNAPNPFSTAGPSGSAGGPGTSVRGLSSGLNAALASTRPAGGMPPVRTGDGPLSTTGRPTGYDAMGQYADEVQKAYDDARRANEERYAQLLQDYTDQRVDVADRLGGTIDNMDARYGAARDALDERYADTRKSMDKLYGKREKEVDKRSGANRKELDARYGERLDGAMARLRGAGEREAADIRAGAQADQGRIDQNLVNRGFANSGVSETLRMGNSREKNNQLSRLGERLRGEEQNVYGQMTGERLAALERMGSQGLSAYLSASGDRAGAMGGLDASQIAALERSFGNQTNAAERGYGNLNDALTRIDERRAGTIENRTDSYPDMSGLYNMAQQYGVSGGAPGSGGSGNGKPELKAPTGLGAQGRLPARRDVKKPEVIHGGGGTGGSSRLNMNSPMFGSRAASRPGQRPPQSPTGPSFAPTPISQQQIDAYRQSANRNNVGGYYQSGGAPMGTIPAGAQTITQNPVMQRPVGPAPQRPMSGAPQRPSTMPQAPPAGNFPQWGPSRNAQSLYDLQAQKEQRRRQAMGY